MSATVAALFVETDGAYYGLENVEPWDEARDARTYAGPHAVVAHPPCSRWCALAGLVEHRWGHKRGEDGGCFASALASVRNYGGVLEHPAYSHAWPAFDLPTPNRIGGWQRGMCGGWSVHVEQSRYGHAAKKATWLYVFGTDELPRLRDGYRRHQHSEALVSWCANRIDPAIGARRRVGRKNASRSTPEFRDTLIAIARTCRGAQ